MRPTTPASVKPMSAEYTPPKHRSGDGSSSPPASSRPPACRRRTDHRRAGGRFWTDQPRPGRPAVEGRHPGRRHADGEPLIRANQPEWHPRGPRGLTLPGNVQANDDAVIHARVSGYLKKWYVDIGAQVKAGQVLAEIDAPELDQQVVQARANLATAQANQNLAQITAGRWASLLAKDAVSEQEADEKTGDLAAKSAVTQAARADVDRLTALEAFKRIVSPFDGVVTARNTDIGALIAAGNPSATPGPVHCRRRAPAAHLSPCAAGLHLPDQARPDRRHRRTGAPGPELPGDADRHLRRRVQPVGDPDRGTADRQCARPAQARRLCPGGLQPAAPARRRSAARRAR